MWKYYEKNVGLDSIVAAYFDSNGTRVLNVIADRDSHYTQPVFAFIRSYSVNYSTEAKLSGEKDTDSTNEVLKKRLIAGCSLIEDDLKEQIIKIRNIIDYI